VLSGISRSLASRCLRSPAAKAERRTRGKDDNHAAVVAGVTLRRGRSCVSGEVGWSGEHDGAGVVDVAKFVGREQTRLALRGTSRGAQGFNRSCLAS
jgi:hypothetical protein